MGRTPSHQQKTKTPGAAVCLRESAKKSGVFGSRGELNKKKKKGRIDGGSKGKKKQMS